MIPFVTFAGFSGSGKTTVVEGVVSILARRGYTVSCIKHHHKPMQIGTDGKDTTRHKNAGAACTILSTPTGYSLVADAENPSLETLLAMVPITTDIVIGEGFKSSDKPKIEVFRSNPEGRACVGDKRLFAIATDIPDSPLVADAPVLLDLNNHEQIADYIEKRFIRPEKDKLHLVVNGEMIPTKDFLREMLVSSVTGLVTPLKGCEDPQEIVIRIKRI